MIVDDWRGRTWDYDGDVRVLSAAGIEDMVRNAAQVGNGTVRTPAILGPKTFILQLLVLADSDEDMAAKVDDIKAATWNEDEQAEDPLTFTLRGEPTLTVFGRVTNRVVPTDFEVEDRYQACTIPIAFECTDALVYLPEVTGDLDGGESVTLVGGWASSKRWKWTAAGPVANPRLKVATPGYPDLVVRCSGSATDLVVESKPDRLITTVNGDEAFYRFDNGTTGVAARFPKLINGQTVTFLGSGTGTFSYWLARP